MVSRADGVVDGSVGFVSFGDEGEPFAASLDGEADDDDLDFAVCDALGEAGNAFDAEALDWAGLACEDSDGELLCGEFDA